MVVVLLGVVAYQATRTALALRAAEADATRLQSQLGEDDLDGADRTAADLRDHARTARTHSDGVLWHALTWTPVLGDDAAAVRDLSAALDDVASVAPAGLDAVDALTGGGLRDSGGRIDVAAIGALAAPVAELDEATLRASRAVADVRPDDLVGPLAGPAESFLERLHRLRQGAAAGAAAVDVLPGLLGADGARSYLLVVQNNAEIRSGGGLPGSTATLRVEDGQVSLGAQGNAADVGQDTPPVDEFLPGEQKTFGRLLLTDFRDAVFTPDFPRAASLMAAHVTQAGRPPVDGVISIDPVTLAQMLRATGPVKVGGVELTADDAVRQLLNEPYLRLPTNEQQDAFFALAAQRVFDVVAHQDLDLSQLVTTLGEAASQRRLLFWSADDDVQDRLDSYAVAGVLPRDTGRPEVGVYLDDSTQAKMQYYLRYGGEIESAGCDRRGRQLLKVTVTLRNVFEGDGADFPEWVVGFGATDVPLGGMVMQMRMFAPYAGELTGLEVDGERTEVGQSEVYDRQSTQLRVQLGPGETTEVVATFVAGPDQDGSPRLQWTPGIEWGPTQAVARPGC